MTCKDFTTAKKRREMYVLTIIIHVRIHVRVLSGPKIGGGGGGGGGGGRGGNREGIPGLMDLLGGPRGRVWEGEPKHNCLKLVLPKSHLRCISNTS